MKSSFTLVQKVEQYVDSLTRDFSQGNVQDCYQGQDLNSGPRRIQEIAYDNGFFPWKARGEDPELVVIGDQLGCFDKQIAQMTKELSILGVSTIGLDGGEGIYKKGSGRIEGDKFRFRYTRKVRQTEIPFEGQVPASHYLREVADLSADVVFNLSRPVLSHVHYRLLGASLDRRKRIGKEEAAQDLQPLEQVDVQILSFPEMAAWWVLNSGKRSAVFLAPRNLGRDTPFEDRLITTREGYIKTQLLRFFGAQRYQDVDFLHGSLMTLAEGDVNYIMASGREPGLLDVLYFMKHPHTVPVVDRAITLGSSDPDFLPVLRRIASLFEGKDLGQSLSFIDQVHSFVSQNPDNAGLLLKATKAEALKLLESI